MRQQKASNWSSRILFLLCFLPVTANAIHAQPLPAAVLSEKAEPITLHQATDLALQSHLQTQLYKEKIRESEARVQAAWAELNPTVAFNTNQYSRSLNMASQGLVGQALPFPSFIGPFYTFDSRLQILYTFVDAARHWRAQAAEISLLIAQQELSLARQQVDLLTATAYIQLISALQAQHAGLADLQLTQRNLQLAQHQKQQGVAAGIDVTRAQAQEAQQELKQATLEEQLLRANLSLTRLMGKPLDKKYLPSDSDLPTIELGLTHEAATQIGQSNRIELIIARLQEEQLDRAIAAADASASPKLGLIADYGFSGNTPGQNVYSTHNVGLSLQIPLFDGGVSQAQAQTLKSQLEQVRLKRHDQEIQVEHDVRSCFLKLKLAQEQISTSNTSMTLAEKESAMASDRFAAGLGTSLELVEAQARLARARDAQVQAKTTYQLAQIGLAASMGKPELLVLDKPL